METLIQSGQKMEVLVIENLTKAERKTENSLRENFQNPKTKGFQLNLQCSCHFK
jgi:hypothetical protein